MLAGIKRIYEKASIMDGKRILVDRLWPRGVKRSTANVDEWIKDVAPSDELRQWWHKHDESSWTTFKKRYLKELNGSKSLEKLVNEVRMDDVTLLYAAHNTKHNNAVVLAEAIKKMLKRSN